MMTVPHQDCEDFEDRLHMSVGHVVELTLQPPGVFRAGDGMVLSSSPVHVVAGLWQHYRERDPHVTLIINDKTDVDFTIAEAAALAAALTTPGDEYVMITLTLEDSDTWLEGQPSRLAVRPRQFGIRLDREQGGCEAQVVTVYHDEYLTLTVAEARELAEALAALIRQAANAAAR
jgi:hypothetical protein